MLTRRNILKRLGIAPTALPFLSNLPSMAAEANAAQRNKAKTRDSLYSRWRREKIIFGQQVQGCSVLTELLHNKMLCHQSSLHLNPFKINYFL